MNLKKKFLKKENIILLSRKSPKQAKLKNNKPSLPPQERRKKKRPPQPREISHRGLKQANLATQGSSGAHSSKTIKTDLK